jgi:hypothetical protein
MLEEIQSWNFGSGPSKGSAAFAVLYMTPPSLEKGHSVMVSWRYVVKWSLEILFGAFLMINPMFCRVLGVRRKI